LPAGVIPHHGRIVVAHSDGIIGREIEAEEVDAALGRLRETLLSLPA
jgi:hypothetical protein